MTKKLLFILIAMLGMTLQISAQTFGGKSIGKVFPEVKKMVVVNASKANLRVGANVSFPVKEQARRGKRLAVFDEEGEWYVVSGDMYVYPKLYISKSLCKEMLFKAIPANTDYHYYNRGTGQTDIIHVNGDLNLILKHTDSDMGGIQMDLGRDVNGMFIFYYNIMAYDIDNWKDLTEKDVEQIFRIQIQEGMNCFYVMTMKDIEEAKKEFGDN